MYNQVGGLIRSPSEVVKKVSTSTEEEEVGQKRQNEEGYTGQTSKPRSVEGFLAGLQQVRRKHSTPPNEALTTQHDLEPGEDQ